MTLATRSATVLAVVGLSLLLAGCDLFGGDSGTLSTAQAIDDSTITSATPTSAEGAASGDGAAAGGTCPSVPQEGYDLYSTDQVVEVPADGAVYGDGTPVSWTFTGPVEGTPDVDMYYVNSAGDAIAMGGIFLEDFGANTWGSTLNVFDSAADGRPGFMVLGLTHDAAGDGNGNISGTHEIVGVYCVTYKVSE